MLQLIFLGTSAARPTVERAVPSIVIARRGETLMFDCGEGTQRQMMCYRVSFGVSHIFFTHFSLLVATIRMKVMVQVHPCLPSRP